MKSSVIFSHGFEGKPTGSKPQYISDLGYSVNSLDLYQRGISLASMVEIISEAMRENPEAIIVGSSMGGLASALAVNASSQPRKVLLLAPAFECADLFKQKAGDRFTEWAQRGSIPYFHQGFDREIELSFEFYQEVDKLSRDFCFSGGHHIKIIHGLRDESIDYMASERVVTLSKQSPTPPSISLHLVEAEHRLGEPDARAALTQGLLELDATVL